MGDKDETFDAADERLWNEEDEEAENKDGEEVEEKEQIECYKVLGLQVSTWRHPSASWDPCRPMVTWHVHLGLARGLQVSISWTPFRLMGPLPMVMWHVHLGLAQGLASL